MSNDIGMMQPSDPQVAFERESQTYYNQYKRGLGLYQKDIFEIYNPKNACVKFSVDVRTGELMITMAPAIPNNPAIGMRGPVQKGAKIYDWDKRAVSYFASVDVFNFVAFLNSKYNRNINDYGAWITTSCTSIDTIKNQLTGITSNPNMQVNDVMNSLNWINSKLDEMKGYFASITSAIDSDHVDNRFGLYRRSSLGDKAWNFNFDPNMNNMLHINCKYKDTFMKTSLSSKMARTLLMALESYSSNYAIIQTVTNNFAELSKTLATNNILAPIGREANDAVI